MGKEIVVITGGGTGGHLKIADTFIDEFKKLDVEVIFIGSINGQDKAWFENDERLKETFFLDTRGVVNKGKVGKVLSLINMTFKAMNCMNIFKKYKIKKVISVGGFSAAPATFASILTKNCNLYIHEQNSVMGKLNQITKKYAKEIFSSYLDSSKIKDYPVSSVFFEKARVRTQIKTIGFFGGSQGAKAINDFALSIAKDLDEKGIKIIHQAGKNDFARVKKEYEKLGINADVFGFTKNFISKMNECDFCLSRAGASTLWELAANNLPALFIPFKYAAANHQYYNAKDLLDKNLCFLKNEDDLNKEEFLEILDCDIKAISEGLKNSISKDAASKIVKTILEN
jgi:UDP-N-acetylglucosamine--N-acetylmuramyl-(pentapeptide) pyrophosphoryl-undecaprenol N-acetylglucosamine transferase